MPGPDPKPVSEGGIGRKKPRKGWRARGRIIATREQWDAIYAAKRGKLCRICETSSGMRELHHLVPRGRGGDDVADNIVPLCKSCHDAVTKNDSEYLRDLAERLTDAEYAYIIGKLGEGGMARLFGVLR